VLRRARSTSERRTMAPDQESACELRTRSRQHRGARILHAKASVACGPRRSRPAQDDHTRRSGGRLGQVHANSAGTVADRVLRHPRNFERQARSARRCLRTSRSRGTKKRGRTCSGSLGGRRLNSGRVGHAFKRPRQRTCAHLCASLRMTLLHVTSRTPSESVPSAWVACLA
jgi:hypothetical protein